MNNNKKTSSKFAWNDAIILDKIQEILNGKNIDELELTEENLENIKKELNNSLSFDELNSSGSAVASNIPELNVLPNEEIKNYISRLINYLNNHNLNSIIGEFQGIEFEVKNNDNIDNIFKEYYNKYNEIYGISDMVSDLLK